MNTIPTCLHTSEIAHLPAGTRIFQAGDPCTQFFYVLDGEIRVDLMADNGRTVLLYQFGAGEICILTTSGLMSDKPYAAEARTITDVTARILQKDEFEAQLDRSQEFRTMVFSTFSERLANILDKIDDIAFKSINQRLARRLCDLANDQHVITITQEQLAQDVGTAREVITRKLLKWESENLLMRDRGIITLTVPAFFEALKQ